LPPQDGTAPPADLAEQRSDRALEADRLLRGLFTETVGTGDDPRAGQGLALVAVGGYGRSELSPASDLDVVLMHDPSVPEERVREVAEAIWYPLWDRGVALDHSVRDTVQMRETAALDHRAATGMLDARTVAGDAGLVLALRSEVLADWRRDARRRLAEVRETREARIARSGWLAHSAVPDLKESGGGLRDGVMMRALVATWLVDVPHAETEGLRSALLDVRDALHEVSGRRFEKLDSDHIVDVARFLDRAPEELELHTRNIGRRLAHLAALAWRRVDDVLESRPTRTAVSTAGPAVAPLAEGVGQLDDEVIVMRDADPRDDPEVALRAASVAAQAGLPLGSNTAAHLADTLGELPEPWSASATRAIVDLLTAGPGLVPVWDELDYAGVVDHWLPEWADIRLRGSSSPVHRYTVDRHSIETCVKAAEVVRGVDRPDLLAVGALLHDIGKGRSGDHSEVGDAMAVDIARRWGFTEPDARTIGRLVRWHLLLPNIATRRDIEDPSTAANVAEIVESAAFLDLLAALTQADARATGPSAWSSWRRGLVRGLVAKVHEVLADDVSTPDAESYEGWPTALPMPEIGSIGDDDLRLDVENHRGGSLLRFVTRDRIGVLAGIAGGLALLGLEIRSARTATEGDAAVSLWEVSRPDVDVAKVRERMRPVLAGQVDLPARLALDPTHDDVPARITVLHQRSETATLLEVRAHDRRGLVWTVCDAITGLGHSIRSAHLSTYGHEARDVFYVVDAAGEPLDDGDAERMRHAVESALT
jgi:[protein-PII] uridylyltransferase